MLRTTLLTAGFTLALALPASADTKAYDMGPFSQLDTAAGVTVYFEAGEAQSIIAENDSGNFEKLVIENKDGTLHVSRKPNYGLFRRNRQNYTVRITGPAISGIDASSGSSVTASGIIGDDVSLEISSGATLTASEIQSGNIALKASSGASMKADGTCRAAALETSSGASITANTLLCERVTARASSGSSISANASNAVNGRASSGASISVSGGATEVDSEKSSGGSVTVS